MTHVAAIGDADDAMFGTNFAQPRRTLSPPPTTYTSYVDLT